MRGILLLLLLSLLLLLKYYYRDLPHSHGELQCWQLPLSVKNLESVANAQHQEDDTAEAISHTQHSAFRPRFLTGVDKKISNTSIISADSFTISFESLKRGNSNNYSLGNDSTLISQLSGFGGLREESSTDPEFSRTASAGLSMSISSVVAPNDTLPSASSLRFTPIKKSYGAATAPSTPLDNHVQEKRSSHMSFPHVPTTVAHTGFRTPCSSFSSSNCPGQPAGVERKASPFGATHTPSTMRHTNPEMPATVLSSNRVNQNIAGVKSSASKTDITPQIGLGPATDSSVDPLSELASLLMGPSTMQDILASVTEGGGIFKKNERTSQGSKRLPDC